MVIKLKSGKEVELKPLTFMQRAELKDLALKNYRENIPVSLVTCGKALIYASSLNEKDLDEWNDNDIYEAGAEIFSQMNLKETDKKK